MYITKNYSTALRVVGDIYEYNDTTGFVGSAKGTATSAGLTNTSNGQQMSLTFNNPQFTVASGNRVVVVLSITDDNNGQVAILWGSIFTATTPEGPTFFTLTEGN